MPGGTPHGQEASIHFPLAREDIEEFMKGCLGIASIHFPLAREDTRRQRKLQIPQIASIHFPLAREDPLCICIHSRLNASIHFPLAREDFMMFAIIVPAVMLQSTSLLRGKTFQNMYKSPGRRASIHFPLAREDFLSLPATAHT